MKFYRAIPSKNGNDFSPSEFQTRSHDGCIGHSACGDCVGANLEDAQTHFQQCRWLSIALIIINIAQRMCFRHISEKKLILVAEMSMHGTFFALQKSKNNGRPQNLVGKTSEVDF